MGLTKCIGMPFRSIKTQMIMSKFLRIEALVIENIKLRIASMLDLLIISSSSNHNIPNNIKIVNYLYIRILILVGSIIPLRYKKRN